VLCSWYKYSEYCCRDALLQIQIAVNNKIHIIIFKRKLRFCILQLQVIIFPCLFSRSFGTVCSKCSKGISASHWVRKARDHVYHLACFRCDACDRQLNTGEEFALHEGRVLCKPHYLDIVDGGTTSSSGTHLFYYIVILLLKRKQKICFTVIFSPFCFY